MKSLPPSTKIAIQPGTKALRLERCDSFWRLWIHAALDFSTGTFLELHDNGSIENVTIDPDGLERRFCVKGSQN